MLHPIDDFVPEVINSVSSTQSRVTGDVIEIATTNKFKLKEFRRLLPDFTIEGVNISVEEVQSMNPHKVAEHKAKAAWEANGYNPILVEDTSLDLIGLGGLPGPFAAYFVTEPFMRKAISERWLDGANRRAIARVILAIYDGRETQIFEGATAGEIAESPTGGDGFAFDYMFIPDGQPNGVKFTFAQMGPRQKDKYSMRARAVEEFKKTGVRLGEWIYVIPEPFDSELVRIDYKKLSSKKAIKFAFGIEGIEKANKPNGRFEAANYDPVSKIDTKFYKRYLTNSSSSSIGIVVTDVDRVKSMIHKNGEPVLWQMGPKRRKLALAQRADYFLRNTSIKVMKAIEKIDSGEMEIIQRNNRRHPSIERLLALTKDGTTTEAHSLKELGYKKLSSSENVSRTESAQVGVYNMMGKYARCYMGIGSMPAVSGWRDVITTAIISNIPVFIARNNVFAEDIDLRIDLIKDVKRIVKSLSLGAKMQSSANRNIGVAIGSNPGTELKKVKRFYEEAGVRLFRIYSINSDPRVLETAVKIRNEFGEKIELFVGQIAEKKQARKLVELAKVDALIFGHGGGRQCTSAVNGMAISAIEDLYEVVTDPFFNSTTVIQEGGVGRNIGPLLILGVDGVLYNQQLTRGSIESGGLFLQDRNGKFGQPYHGSASAPTMIIESANSKLKHRLNASGRTKVPEGKPGFAKFTYKANSMTFWIDEFKHHIARTMADLGVKDFAELREFLAKDNREFLRIVSSGAAAVAQAYKS